MYSTWVVLCHHRQQKLEKAREYRFSTAGELVAFIQGIEAASGTVESATFNTEEEANKFIEKE